MAFSDQSGVERSTRIPLSLWITISPGVFFLQKSNRAAISLRCPTKENIPRDENDNADETFEMKRMRRNTHTRKRVWKQFNETRCTLKKMTSSLTRRTNQKGTRKEKKQENSFFAGGDLKRTRGKNDARAYTRHNTKEKRARRALYLNGGHALPLAFTAAIKT